MLGFSAVAQVPIGQASAIFNREGKPTGVAATSAVAAVTTISDSGITLAGQTATGVVTVPATGVAGKVPSVVGTGVVNAPAGIFSKQLTGVAATGAVNLPFAAFKQSAAIVLPSDNEFDGFVGTLTFSISQAPTLTGVSMTLSHGSASDIFDADANKAVTGVAGTGAVSAVTFDAQATNTPVSVNTTGFTGTLTQTAKANKALTGNATTSAIAALTTRAAASATITGAEVIAIAERDTTANGNLFDYGPFADNFSRVRTFTVTNGASSTDNTVYITI